jgi:hypothetical protein
MLVEMNKYKVTLRHAFGTQINIVMVAQTKDELLRELHKRQDFKIVKIKKTKKSVIAVVED